MFSAQLFVLAALRCRLFSRKNLSLNVAFSDKKCFALAARFNYYFPMTPTTNSTSSSLIAFLVSGSQNLSPRQLRSAMTSIKTMTGEVCTPTEPAGHRTDEFDSRASGKLTFNSENCDSEFFRSILSKTPVIPQIPLKPIMRCRLPGTAVTMRPNVHFTPVYRRLSGFIGFQFWGLNAFFSAATNRLFSGFYPPETDKNPRKAALSTKSHLLPLIILSRFSKCAPLLVALGFFHVSLVSAQQPADLEQSIKNASAQIEKDPTNPQAWLNRASLYIRADQSRPAVADLSKVIELAPGKSAVYQARGIEHFKLAEMKEAVADFDKFVDSNPDQDPYHWQRGIAYFYANEFEKGQKQFERHQTVNGNDVENAVWHFLCVARAKSFDEARRKLIPISGDSRVPMSEVHQLFAGKSTPEKVLNAAAEGSPAPEALQNRLFYANLYIGLFEEASGHPKESLEYIRKAVTQSERGDYMGIVARVHLKLRENQKTN
jgi:lipoprotein NlpI